MRLSSKRPHHLFSSLLTVLALIALLFLAACSPNQLLDDGAASPSTQTLQNSTLRPVVPRSEPLQGKSFPSRADTDAPVLEHFLNTTLFVRTAPGGIVAGDALHPFLLGKKLGDVLPLLTRHQLTTLAEPQPSIKGRTLRADAYVRFDFDNETSGVLRYVRNPTTYTVGSELFFAEGAPMFEYAYLLQDGSFPALIGETIGFFGHDYVVKEASNTSVELYGQNVEQYLLLRNGSALSINGASYAHTRVRVDPWSVMIRYFAPAPDDSGIRLKPGESLRAKLQNDVILLNPLFDIIYDGLDQQPSDTAVLHRATSGIFIDVHDLNGTPVTLPLASTTGWGERDHPLHVTECDSASDYCIGIDEQFFVTTRSGLSRVFEFLGASVLGDTLQLRDVVTNEHYVLLPVDTHRSLENRSILDGTLDIDGSAIRVAILLDESPVRGKTRISVDMDDDGSINGDALPLVLNRYHEIIFPDDTENNQTNTTRHIALRSLTLPGAEEETIPITLLLDPVMGFSVGNITFGRVNDTDTYEGMSGRGVLLSLQSQDGATTGSRLTLSYPIDYRSGLVRIIG